MPELPEVETMRLQLNRFLVGHKILSVKVNLRKILPEGENLLVDGKIINVRRFAKVIVVDLDNGYSFLMHSKMTGQPIYRGPNLKAPPDLSKKVVGGVPGKHTHVEFKLDCGGYFYFNDYRRFGWIKIAKSEELKGDSFIGKLGPEFLKDLNLKLFRQIIGKSSRPIKLVLIDQTKISGLGNIYANEALFDAGINPKRPANKLGQNEQVKLFKSIVKVLKDGIKYGGASENAYVTPEGSEGDYQDHFLVYDRKGRPCLNKCGNLIEKIKLGGRGTYFCPQCQK